MTWQPITFQELEELGRRIDSRFVHADSVEGLYAALAKYPHEEWTLIRAPGWCDDKIVALIVRPRNDDDDSDDE